MIVVKGEAEADVLYHKELGVDALIRMMMPHSKVSEKLSVASAQRRLVVQSLGAKIQAYPIMEPGKGHLVSDAV